MNLHMMPPTKTFQDKGISVRHGKAHIYQRRDSADIRESIRSRMIKYIPDQPLTGFIQAEIWLFYPPTEKIKSLMNRRHIKYYPKSTKPDCDNLSKQILDIMQELGFYKNDSQIFLLTVAKIYVAATSEIKPGIRIVLNGGFEDD